jgi:hypothetical protein
VFGEIKMKKIILLFTIMLFIISNHCFPSEIIKISLSELQEKADLIVLAKVINVEQDMDKDKITIKIDSALKGKIKEKELSFTLVTRGGLKDFDPALKKGDTGVFFLKKKEAKVEKAYWGSIATFQKNNFDLTEDKK